MRTTNLSQIENLLDVYYVQLFRFAERLSGSPTRAMLLTHRTFNLAIERSLNLPSPANMRAWLFAILFNKFLETRPHLPHA